MAATLLDRRSAHKEGPHRPAAYAPNDRVPHCAIRENEIPKCWIRKEYEHKMDETTYALGHAAAEIQRLANQAAMLRPITERLLRSAGINAGVRVLDLGCGAGDVSMLAAELVGPGGSVVGIDRSQEVLKVARERAQEAGLRQIRFVRSSVEELVVDEPFDLVIGRYILVHQSEPVALLRKAARLVRPGGALAFHEVRMTGVTKSFPCVPLWDLTITLFESLCSRRSPTTMAPIGSESIFPRLACRIPIYSARN
jgi:ubiquinone/menaquinone biosynthesis C-methylase UbiE